MAIFITVIIPLTQNREQQGPLATDVEQPLRNHSDFSLAGLSRIRRPFNCERSIRAVKMCEKQEPTLVPCSNSYAANCGAVSLYINRRVLLSTRNDNENDTIECGPKCYLSYAAFHTICILVHKKSPFPRLRALWKRSAEVWLGAMGIYDGVSFVALLLQDGSFLRHLASDYRARSTSSKCSR